MTRACLSSAWKLLFTQLVMAMGITYLTAMTLVKFNLVTPAEVFNTATNNLSLVSEPFREAGLAMGLDHGVLIFFCNLSVAVMILVAFYWTTLLNPEHNNRKFGWLRRRLQRDRSADLLQKVPPFSRIRNPQLRVISFLLLMAPSLATISLGILAGVLLAAAHSMSGSALLAVAYILPHGVAEITAFLLACCVPMAAWFAIRPAVRQEKEDVVFQRIDHMATSEDLQGHLKMMINMLLIAGLIEAHFTLKVVAMLSRI